MTLDPIRAAQEMRKAGKKDSHLPALVLCAAYVLLSYVMYVRQFTYTHADFYLHAAIADYFDFTDLHTITSRIAYPMWHLLVRTVKYMGATLEGAAVGVSTVVKGLTYLLVYGVLNAMSNGSFKRWMIALLSFVLVLVTPVLIPSVNKFVYAGVGSPNVWHNPTQQLIMMVMLLVMPWLGHCWYEFERRVEAGEENVMLPWWKIVLLAVLCMGSVACKATFMQALLPAAFVMYLVELCRRPREWRYFGQIILAFLPAAAYFLLQYLYYTGVVVEYTSGVEFGITLETAWVSIRNALLMGACPFAALIVCWRKGLFKDRMLVLALLMVAFSALEAMAFRETGQRQGHGNFTWASNSSAFFQWVVMAGVFLREMRSRKQNGELCVWRKVGIAGVLALLAWHLYSGVYYLYFLFSTENTF